MMILESGLLFWGHPVDVKCILRFIACKIVYVANVVVIVVRSLFGIYLIL